MGQSLIFSECLFLTRSLARDIIILLKSSIKLSIKKTPKVAAKGVFLCLLKALRLDYLSHLSCHLRISHSVISSELTPTSSGSRTSSIKHFSIKSHLLSSANWVLRLCYYTMLACFIPWSI